MKKQPGFKRLQEVRRGKAVEIEVDGHPLKAFLGESVATALLSAGIFSCQTHDDRPMGIFCNIGQCCSCLMVIDGTSGVRACQTPVCSGLKVLTRKVVKRVDPS